MEFFINEILPVLIGFAFSLLCFLMGIIYAKKKFQPQDEAPKVSTNEEAKEFEICKRSYIIGFDRGWDLAKIEWE